MAEEFDGSEEYYDDEGGIEINLDATHASHPTSDTDKSHTDTSVSDDIDEDPEIAEMKRKLREMEEEENKISALSSTDPLTHSPGQSQSLSAQPSLSAYHSQQLQSQSTVDSAELDSRSVYVGNVDYSATKEELESLFSACGPVNRVTILIDKFTGHPKGFAYIEFRDRDSISAATILNDTEFKGRQLKVTAKRTNVPAFQLRGRGRGRGGYRGAPRGRGGYAPSGGYGPVRGRGRGRGGYAPY